MQGIGRWLSVAMVSPTMAVILAVLASSAANAFTIQEFVAVQQKGACTGAAAPPCPADQLFVPPVPNYNGWSGLQDGSRGCTFQNGDVCRFAPVDYAGIADQYLRRHGSRGLGTWFEGTVRERPLDAHRLKVAVTLITHRALIWISKLTSYDVFTGHHSIFLTSPLLFGARPADVLRGRRAALAESVFEVRYVARRGAPIPNLITLLQSTPSAATFVRYRAWSIGPLGPAFTHPANGVGKASIAQLAPDGRDFVTQKIALKTLCVSATYGPATCR